MHEFISWLTSGRIVGLATVIGFVLVLYQIWSSRQDVRISRAIDLMGRYYSEYHELDISLRDRDLSPKELEQLGRNYQKQLNFLYELAMYWKRGLIDKKIVKHELSSKIAYETFVLQQVYRGQEMYSDRLRALIDMKDEMVMKDSMNYKLVKFWNSLGIKKSYFP